MNFRVLAASAIAGCIVPTAFAQLSSIRPAQTKAAPQKLVAPDDRGSFIPMVGGADSCATPDAISGTGPFNFTTGTTGAEGQANATCLFFGQTGISNDVWFTWTAGSTGNATLSLCGGATIDSKVAVYNGSGCPGAAPIACNDDSCGLQSQLAFSATNGNQYTVQLGNFPGATGGSGTFTINVAGGGGGNDSCGSATALAGPGPYPFDNSAATTGAEGQGNANCLFFGQQGISNDIWFTWTATGTGSATLDLCGLAGMDSKVAIYSGAGCPGAAALSCNDDSCGLQSSVTWSATLGNTYTIQLGNFPGATGGSGSFRISIAGPVGPCDNHDDGSSENAIGLTAGGALMWLQRFGAVSQNTTVTQISSAWGSPINPPSGNPANGSAVTVAIYSDPDNDGNPTNAVLQQTVGGLMVGSGTDAFQTFNLAPAVTINGHVWAGAAMNSEPAGVFPAPLDQPADAPFAGQAWIVGQTGGGPLNFNNLGANNVAPLDIASAGFPGQWLLRITCGAGGNNFCVPHTAGTGPCPCTAGTLPGHGCNNSDNTGGALLTTAGTASLTADTLVFTSTGEKATATSVFLQASAQQNGVTFGQGRLCLGGTLLRLYVKSAVAGVAVAPTGADASVHNRSAQLGDVLSAGATRFHQVHYRDPIVRLPCDPTLDTFNTSQGTSVTWAP